MHVRAYDRAGARAPTGGLLAVSGSTGSAMPRRERCDFAVEIGIREVEVRQVFDQFSDHHAAKGSVMADWTAAWRTVVPKRDHTSTPGKQRANSRPTKADWSVCVMQEVIVTSNGNHLASIDQNELWRLRKGYGFGVRWQSADHTDFDHIEWVDEVSRDIGSYSREALVAAFASIKMTCRFWLVDRRDR